MHSRALALLLFVAVAAGAHAEEPLSATRGMIKLAAIWEASNDYGVLDEWYRATHSTEVLLFVGPWLRRYWTYRALDVPEEADRFNVVRYRLTEMWYDNIEARNESAPVLYPLTPPPMDTARYPDRNRIANIVNVG